MVSTKITITLCIIAARSNPYTRDADTDQSKARLFCKSKDTKLKGDLNDAVIHENSSLDWYEKHWQHWNCICLFLCSQMYEYLST